MSNAEAIASTRKVSNVTTARRAARAAPALSAAWARTQDEVREAQRLRFRVFAGEMGARLAPIAGAPPGHDIDRFDEHCEHLLVRAGDEVVGTYRVLTPAGARRAGGRYSDTEFDLAPIAPLLARCVEIGRSCVHPDWRSGGVILALWNGLADFMLRHRLDSMIGCASIGMRDGGHYAASVWRQLSREHLADARWRVQPRLALPVDALCCDLEVEAPALVKGYLRCGAKLLGTPAWDPDFGTADLPLLMRVAELPERYRRHFMSEAATA